MASIFQGKASDLADDICCIMSENCREVDWPHCKQLDSFEIFTHRGHVRLNWSVLRAHSFRHDHDSSPYLSTEQPMPSSMSATDDLPSLLWITYVSKNNCSFSTSLTYWLSIPPMVLLSAYFVRKWYLAKRLKLYGIGKGGESLNFHFTVG